MALLGLAPWTIQPTIPSLQVSTASLLTINQMCPIRPGSSSYENMSVWTLEREHLDYTDSVCLSYFIPNDYWYVLGHLSQVDRLATEG